MHPTHSTFLSWSKRVIWPILCFLLAFGVSSCSDTPQKTSENSTNSEQVTQDNTRFTDSPIPQKEAPPTKEEPNPPDAGTPTPEQGAVKEQTPKEAVPPPEKNNPIKDQAKSPWTHPKQPYKGKATWYKADGSGNCSFPKASGVPMVVAMNEKQYAQANLCGACLRVSYKGKSVVVKVVDRCPECPMNALDLSREAFSRLADNKVGVIQVSWQMIPCSTTSPMQYFYKEGSSQWWTALQVRNHRKPIEQLSLYKSGKWTKLKRERFNYFIDTKGFGKSAVRIQVKSLDGQVIEETLPAPSSRKLVNGRKQFR